MISTRRSFEPIFMRFAWLVWVHPWVNRTVVRNKRPNATIHMGENMPPKPVL